MPPLLTAGRRPVLLLPVPTIPEGHDDEVFLLKQTGEIFLTFEEYSNRLDFLRSKLFSCETTGKSNLNYFQAYESEKAESRLIRDRFPDELKGRVLHSVQHQVMGRLDQLVERLYERYQNRFFAGEKVFVDLSGDRYYSRVASVFPPAIVRERSQGDNAVNGHASTSTAVQADPAGPAGGPYDQIAHKTGIDLNQDKQKADKLDPADDYMYSVQVIDNEKFDSSFIEVKAKQLSRDRLSFSRAILKRYIKECVQRDTAIASPWIVKPALAEHFRIPQQLTQEAEQKAFEIREGHLNKRRKNPSDLNGSAPPRKRRSLAPKTAENGSEAGQTAAPARTPWRPPKYPIEDLDLDPMTIHDGRVLRRVNSDLPDLPPKPKPNRNLPVPEILFDTLISTWNMLNIFSKPLCISNFSLDDFVAALSQTTAEPRCHLLIELHASLTNLIATDSSRVLGTTGAAPLHVSFAPVEAEGDELDAVEVDTDEFSHRTLPDAELVRQRGEAEEEELDTLLRKGINFSRKWDRMSKLKSAEGRAGWERHVIGALCQRGGPLHLQNIDRILKHFFEGADLTRFKKSTLQANSGAMAPPAAEMDGTTTAADGVPQDECDPEKAYFTLLLEDKIDILHYLCTLALGTKPVRNFVEESESQLTEYRKQRADVNKERRELLEQKVLLEAEKNKTEAEILRGDTPAEPAAPVSQQSTPTIPAQAQMNGNGHPTSEIGTEEILTGYNPNDDAEIDELADDASSARGSVRAASIPDSDFEGKPSAASNLAELDQIELDEFASPAPSLPSKRVGSAREMDLEQSKTLAAHRKQTERTRIRLEELIKANQKKDDFVERQFRRYAGVARTRPLGKDRFFCRYWWFDGMGSMELVSKGVVYGTGRLFVQGPSREDWETVCATRSELEENEKKPVKAEEGSEPKSDVIDESGMLARRKREEVDVDAMLGINEWAFYETEADLDSLQGWLNAKGVRELSLKNALTKWRGYILAGSRKRQQERAILETPHFRAESKRPIRRTQKDPSPPPPSYLTWVNQLAKH